MSGTLSRRTLPRDSRTSSGGAKTSAEHRDHYDSAIQNLQKQSRDAHFQAKIGNSTSDFEHDWQERVVTHDEDEDDLFANFLDEKLHNTRKDNDTKNRSFYPHEKSGRAPGNPLDLGKPSAPFPSDSPKARLSLAAVLSISFTLALALFTLISMHTSPYLKSQAKSSAMYLSSLYAEIEEWEDLPRQYWAKWDADNHVHSTLTEFTGSVVLQGFVPQTASPQITGTPSDPPIPRIDFKEPASEGAPEDRGPGSKFSAKFRKHVPGAKARLLEVYGKGVVRIEEEVEQVDSPAGQKIV